MKVARHIIEARREAIAKLLSKVGYVPVLEICKQFNVSEATARRDLTELENQRRITRTHGGALSDFNRNFPPLDDRKIEDAEAKRKAEEEMDVRTLLQQKEQEWQLQLESERQEREKAFALLERERTYAELNEYRNRRIEEERDNIMPELIDLIAGNNSQEIEESIANLKARSNRIVDAVQAATQSERRQMTGSRVTAPPSGPLDTNTDQSPVSAEQIAAMSVSEYAKYRNKLLGQAASERGKGLFG